MGEFDLLEKVRAGLPPAGPRVIVGSGDDAAVTVPGGATATSVDALVDGVHFRRDRFSLAQIGRKALATALSDLAAMGAAPGEAYIVLGVPPDLDQAGCLELLGGAAAIAAETGVALAGGDLTRAPALTLAVTVVGHAERPELLVRRSGGRPGDLLVLTGRIGGAAAGLLVLDRHIDGRVPFASHSTTDGQRAGLIARQLEPQPRLEAGQALAAAGATAMIDLSDGLGGDATRLAEASGVGVAINALELPFDTGVGAVGAAADIDLFELAVSGGEDYELLAALPAENLGRAAAAVEATGVELSAIGALNASGRVEIRLPGGGLAEPRGFDQLR